MYLDGDLYTYLSSDATLITLLDPYKSGGAIFNDLKIPKDFTGNNSINFYTYAPTSGKFKIENYVINCRGLSRTNSIDIALRVFNLLQRANFDGAGSYCLCEILPTILPEDETDVYNTPINIKIKKTEVI